MTTYVYYQAGASDNQPTLVNPYSISDNTSGDVNALTSWAQSKAGNTNTFAYLDGSSNVYLQHYIDSSHVYSIRVYTNGGLAGKLYYTTAGPAAPLPQFIVWFPGDGTTDQHYTVLSSLVFDEMHFDCSTGYWVFD
jgi:hypothetical protein